VITKGRHDGNKYLTIYVENRLLTPASKTRYRGAFLRSRSPRSCLDERNTRRTSVAKHRRLFAQMSQESVTIAVAAKCS